MAAAAAAEDGAAAHVECAAADPTHSRGSGAEDVGEAPSERNGDSSVAIVPTAVPSPLRHRDIPGVSAFVRGLLYAPRALAAVVLLTALALTALAAPHFDLSQPDGGLRIRDALTAEQADAWYAAVSDRIDALTGDARQLQQSVGAFSLTVIYRAPEGETVLTPDRIVAMRALEDELQATPGWSDYCLLNSGTGNCTKPRSLASDPALFGISGLNKQAAVDGRLLQLARGDAADDLSYFLTADVRDELLADGEDAPGVAEAPLLPITRVTFSFGLPLRDYVNTADRVEDQFLSFQTWSADLLPKLNAANSGNDAGSLAASSGLTIVWMGDGTFMTEALAIMGGDLLLAFIAIGVVVVVAWVHTGSLFLACFSILQVLLSFPTCFFLYRFLLRIKLFGALQVLSVFIILGIGADDSFLAFDALKQSALVPIVRRRFDWRLSWAFRRAFVTMLTTSMTTTFAFAATAVSTIPAIRYFGVFAGLLVLCNLALVCTFYFAVLVIHHDVTARAPTTPLWKAIIGLESATTWTGSAVDTSIEGAHDFGSSGGVDSMQDVQGLGSTLATIHVDAETATDWGGSAAGGGPSAVLSDSPTLSPIGVTEAGPPSTDLAASHIPASPAGGITPPATASEGGEANSHEDPDRTGADDGSPVSVDGSPVNMSRGSIDGSGDAAAPQASVLESVATFHVGTEVTGTARGRAPSMVQSLLTGDSPVSALRDITPAARNPRAQPVGGVTATQKLRPVERWLHGTLAPFVIRNSTYILAATVVQLVVFGSFATQLRPASETFTYWPADHRFNQYFDLRDTFAAEAATVVPLRLVWGIDSIDRTGTDETDINDVGEVVYDEEFNAADPATQEFLASVCDEADASVDELYLRPGQSRCLLRSLRDWRIARQEAFPIPPERFVEVLREFLSRYAFARRFLLQVGFEESEGTGDDSRVTWIWETWNTTARSDAPMETRDAVLQAWQSFLSEQRQSAPETAQTFWVTERWFFVWGTTQLLFLTSAFGSMGLSAVLAFAVLTVATHNWMIAGLATAAIAGIATSVMGLMSMLGWTLGSIESVCLTILIGISVDYVVHLGVALNEGGATPMIDNGADAPSEAGGGARVKTPAEQRAAKVRYSFLTIGVSVLGGAASTFGAGCLLLLATITFFTRFAAFFVSSVLFALLYAMFVFMALAAKFAPLRDQGSTLLFYRWLTSKICRSQAARGSRESRPEVHKTNDSRRGRYAFWGIVAICVGLMLFGVIASLAEPGETPADSDVGSQIDDSVFMPAASDLSSGEWHELRPGGDTQCSRGAPYAFYFRPGEHSPERLVVEFEGGGACWSEETCGVAGSTFKEDLEATRADFLAAHTSGFNAGIRDDAHPDNPVRGWSHLYVPYCTGDVHWGNNVVHYSDQLTIRHKGAVNAAAAVHWARDTLERSPTKVFVTGCSAGAYGSVLWAAHIMHQWPDADVSHMADSGIGVITDSFMRESFASWNTTGIMPYAETGLDPDAVIVEDLRLPDMFRFIGNAFPQNRMSQFTSAFDNNQAFFRKAMLLNGASDVYYEDLQAWEQEARAMLALDAGGAASFVGPGDLHCTIPARRFYDTAVRTRSLTAWLVDLIDGETAVESVDCAVDHDNSPCLVGVDTRPGAVVK